MTLISDAFIAVANRLAHTEKTTFELKQFIDAELEKQKKAFPWMFSHETLRVEHIPQPQEIPAGTTIVPVKVTTTDHSPVTNSIYWSIEPDGLTRWPAQEEIIVDLTNEEVRSYCFGEGHWINIHYPVQLRDAPNGAHIITDSFGNVYTIRPTWNAIMTTMKEDDNNG
jgi:hypothetical protein